jgi:hypothetical protein
MGDGYDRNRVQGSGSVDPRYCAAVVNMRPAHVHPAARVAGVVHGDDNADDVFDLELAGPGDRGNDGHAVADGGKEGESTKVVKFAWNKRKEIRGELKVVVDVSCAVTVDKGASSAVDTN